MALDEEQAADQFTQLCMQDARGVAEFGVKMIALLVGKLLGWSAKKAYGLAKDKVTANHNRRVMTPRAFHKMCPNPVMIKGSPEELRSLVNRVRDLDLPVTIIKPQKHISAWVHSWGRATAGDLESATGIEVRPQDIATVQSLKDQIDQELQKDPSRMAQNDEAFHQKMLDNAVYRCDDLAVAQAMGAKAEGLRKSGQLDLKGNPLDALKSDLEANGFAMEGGRFVDLHAGEVMHANADGHPLTQEEIQKVQEISRQNIQTLKREGVAAPEKTGPTPPDGTREDLKNWDQQQQTQKQESPAHEQPVQGQKTGAQTASQPQKSPEAAQKQGTNFMGQFSKGDTMKSLKQEAQKAKEQAKAAPKKEAPARKTPAKKASR